MAECLVTTPDGWDCATDPSPGIALLLRAPASGTGFRANALVTVDSLDPDMSLRDWQRGTDLRLPATLHGYQLLDLELLDVAGSPGVRRLAHHTAPGGQAVTLGQWAALVGRSGYTLTATAPTLAYLEYADILAGIAASWQITPAP